MRSSDKLFIVPRLQEVQLIHDRISELETQAALLDRTAPAKIGIKAPSLHVLGS